MARTSKHAHLKDICKSLYLTGKGSESICNFLMEEYPEEKIKPSFSRQVRKWASNDGWSNATVKRTSKILLFDIETAPILCYAWGKWGQNIGDDMILRDWFVLSWSAKWLFEDEVYNASLTPKEIKDGNDERIIRSIWNMLDESDVVIAHNLEKFDKKRVQTRFLKYGLNLPSPYNSIDTLQHLRRKFSIISNRLDYVAKDFLGIDGKMETPKGLWWRCLDGDKDAMKTMVEYCDQDVRVLEDVYLKLRPYIQPHPNIGLIEQTNEPNCPCCGSTDLKLSGAYHTYVNEFDVYRCGNCGSISRSRKNSTQKETRDVIKVSVPR